MDLLSFVLLLAAGCAAGFLAGFFGVGGGIILVPILLFFFQSTGVSSLIATHLSFGTSLFVIIFASMASAYEYARNNQVVWRAVLPMGLASAAAAVGAGVLAGSLEGKTLRAFFALVVFFSAFYLFAERRKPKEEKVSGARIPVFVLVGFFIGIVSSLAGVGGGVFSIPVMYSILKFPLKKSLGTSSATIVITATAGAAGYAITGQGEPGLPASAFGFVDVLTALPLVVGSLPCARLGAAVAQKTHVDLLRTIFAILLIVVGIKMLLG